MADVGLDVEALRRDRDRYRGLLAQAEEQISAWNERADVVRQAIGGIEQLLALAGHDVAVDAGPARRSSARRKVAAATPDATPPVATPTRKPTAAARRPAAKPTPTTAPTDPPAVAEAPTAPVVPPPVVGSTVREW